MAKYIIKSIITDRYIAINFCGVVDNFVDLINGVKEIAHRLEQTML